MLKFCEEPDGISKLVRVTRFFSCRRLLIAAVFLLIAALFLNPDYSKYVFGYSSYTFTQSDWSGSASSLISSYPTNATGWTGYYTKDAIINTSNTQTSLSGTNFAYTDTSDSDFSQGTSSNVSIIATGTPAFLSLATSTSPSWQQVTSTPGIISDGGSLAFDGVNKLYALAGGATSTFYVFNIASSSWSITTSTPSAVNYGGALVSAATSTLYAQEGSSTQIFWKFNVGSSWSQKASSSQAVGQGGSLVFNSSDGNIYQIPGALYQYVAVNYICTNNGLYYGCGPGSGFVYDYRWVSQPQFYKYNPTGDSWTSLAAIPNESDGNGGFGAGAALASDGTSIFASRGQKSDMQGSYNCGGFSNCTGVYSSAQTNSFYKYTTSTDSWSQLSSAPNYFQSGSALADDGRGHIYAIFGGATSSFAKYDKANDLWFNDISLPVAVGAGGSLAFDNVDKTIWAVSGSSTTNFLKYNLPQYQTSGVYNSRIITLSNPALSYGALNWDDNSLGAISVKVRSGSTYSMSGAPAWTSCSAISKGANISTGGCVTVGHQFLQYQISLSTSDSYATPELYDITLNYQAAGSGDLVSSVFNTGNQAAQINSISWTGSEPSGAAIKFQIRQSSGAGAPQWDTGVSDTIPRMQLSNASFLYNGKWYVFGGALALNGPLPYNDLRVFDFSTNSWSTLSNDTVGGGKFANTSVVYNNKAYIFGGSTDSTVNGATSSLRIYDFASSTWSNGASDNVGGPRIAHSAVVYNGKMYIFGGINASGVQLNDLRIYDFASDTWSGGNADTVGGARVAHDVVVYQNQMYVFGGFNVSGYSVNDMRIYNFLTGQWSSGVADTVGGPRESHGMVLSDDNKFYVFGGYNRNSGGQVLNDVRIYDFLTNSWSGGLSDPAGGRRAMIFALYKGNFYVFGGNNGTSTGYNDGTTFSDMRHYFTGWSAFCGYSGTCDQNDFFTSSTNGLALPSNHPLNSGGFGKYFQYKVFLSSNSANVPSVNSVTVNFSFPNLQAPQDNAVVSARPQFQWDAFNGATSYQLYIDNNVLQTATANSTQPLSDLACGIHSWHVVGINSAFQVQQSSETRNLNYPCVAGLPPAAYLTPASPSPSPTNPSGGFKIAINSGTTSINSNSVSLSLDGGPDAKMMVISEKPDFVGAGQMPYSTSTIFTLSQGKGEKTIYAKFYNSWGQTSPVVSSTIAFQPSLVPAQPQPPSKISSSLVFQRHLTIGSSGDDVRQLQTILKKLGYFSFPQITYYFGVFTRQAVIKFQKANKLYPYPGWLGPATRAALNKIE